MGQFKPGETFRPLGPPRMSSSSFHILVFLFHVVGKKPKPKRIEQEEGPYHHISSEKRPRDSAERDGSVPPSKRVREESLESPLQSSTITSATRPQARRQPSPEVIPDSDEEIGGSDRLQTLLSPNNQDAAKDSDNTRQEKLPNNDGADDGEEPFDPLFDEPTRKVPEHINRKENPLIKLVESPNLSSLQGAISAKVRAIRDVNLSSSGQPLSTSMQRARPGPGRSSTGLTLKQKSSLLTAERGAMKTIKGKYKKEASSTIEQELPASGRSGSPILVDEGSVDDSAPKMTPSAEELLEMAGLDEGATDLPEFDEAGCKETQVEQTTNMIESSVLASDEPKTLSESKSE